jgi:hypothetical protein
MKIHGLVSSSKKIMYNFEDFFYSMKFLGHSIILKKILEQNFMF